VTVERDGAKLSRVFIGLGSNIEPRMDYLGTAVTGLNKIGDIARVSSVYETAPVGGIPQSDFLNAVVELQTAIQPMELVAELKSLEKMIGRNERPRWHEREIDLDILFYDNLVLQTATLILPHPELHKRAFVLVPMNELDPNFVHPLLKKNVAELLGNVDTTSVRATSLVL
jgi:2-amino-4-hydroxy-6-hydroxymethyldihydropteridine diphosphokinase